MLFSVKDKGRPFFFLIGVMNYCAGFEGVTGSSFLPAPSLTEAGAKGVSQTTPTTEADAEENDSTETSNATQPKEETKAAENALSNGWENHFMTI